MYVVYDRMSDCIVLIERFPHDIPAFYINNEEYKIDRINDLEDLYNMMHKRHQGIVKRIRRET
jgi:hypothetical protein